MPVKIRNMLPTLILIIFFELSCVYGNCSWNSDNDTTATARTSVTCRLRTLERGGVDLSHLQAEGATRLRVECSEVLLFESTLQAGAFNRLQALDELVIDSCKLLHLPPEAFDGLRELKRLSVNSHNTEWGPGKSLELSPTSFQGLRELQGLDLSDNNIRALPEGAICPLKSLQTLNLTRNRIRAAEQLGFYSPRQTQACLGGDELQVLDASYNELKTIPEGWGVSRLRRLQQLLLQYNNVTDLSGEALAGLSSLRVLNLSSNRLESLPTGLFAGSRELREVHLQNNELFELPRGLFHRLEQLLVLDLSGNQLSSHHVDDGTFVGLIRLIVLNLSHNALTRIDSKTFKDLFFLQILDLRNNSIGYVDDNAFLPLYNLHTLNLAENRLHTLDNRLFNGLYVLSKLTLNNNLIVTIDSLAFRNCSDLKELDLSSNQLTEVPNAIHELSMLKSLDLGENQITEFKNGSFKNLAQLTGLRLIDNQIGNLTRGMLWDLPSLQVLNLAKNKVQSIERGTFDRNSQLEAIRLDRNFLSDVNGVFSTLASLLWLNLSENHLVWFDYAFIPANLKWLDIHGNYVETLGNYYKIQEQIKLKTLDASHNRLTEISPMSVPNSVELLFINNNFIKNVQVNTFVDKPSLARVDMYANDLSHLQLHSLRLAPVPTGKPLPEFYLGGNPFQCDCSMEWLQRINNMTASRQHPRVMDLANIECRMPHARGVPIVPLSQVKPADFLCKYETHCFALCHCCDFDACDCEMTCPQNCTCYHDQTWGTNVVDCSAQRAVELPARLPMDATEVFLDGNDFQELQNHAFIGRKNMRTLYVNNSNIESIQNRTFNGLNALQVLHLEDNKLRELKGYEFEHLAHLRELYLQNNLLQYIGNMTLLPLRSLRVLRLDGNRLTSLPVWQLSLNTQLQSLSLGNNQWSCRCKFLQELTTFIADNAQKVIDAADVYCLDDSRPPTKRELDLNGTVCSDFYAGGSVLQGVLVSDYLPYMAASLAALLLLLLLLVLAFIFRDPVRVWLFAHYGVRVFGSQRCAGSEDREKLYDAYVLYSPKDADFVTRCVAAELENGRPSLRLCLHHRDLMADPAYLQVLEAASASRRVIIVLTRNFLQTEWARFEVRRALHEALQGRVFKLVFVEEGEVVPEAEMDMELLPYMKTGARVRWGEKRFWERLRYAMPTGSNSAPYRRNVNTYTLDSSVAHGHNGAHYPEKAAGMVFRQAPPAYCPDGVVEGENDDANYSSATTATPSPRPSRRQAEGHGVHPRPPSEHIYSSIDSDYSTLERGGSGVIRHQNGDVAVHRPQWRPAHNPHGVHIAHGVHQPHVQAYLV